MPTRLFLCLSMFFFVSLGIAQQNLTLVQRAEQSEIAHFIHLLHTTDDNAINSSLTYIKKHWKPEFEIMFLETFYFSHSNAALSLRLMAFLQQQTQQQFGFDYNAWYEYIWKKPQQLHPDYHLFKALLHQYIDPKFATYFKDRQQQALIRFDEIRWGGVPQDGIPPLHNPKMIPANTASYLHKNDVVFGIVINGEARAYPKRILAWHELFSDTIKGTSITGVYCTLCGTVIAYNNTVNGITHKLGTSGFLYRSNKLMYDTATQSLWNTLWGTPVVGPLANKGIQLSYQSVITTTWGTWKKRHPQTLVLSLDTGHQRDYNEGVAYQDYFATHQLMFNTPIKNTELKNKQSILAIKLEQYPNQPLAISTKFLKRNPIYSYTIGTIPMVILTDKTMANRVYNSQDIIFISYNQKEHTVTDSLNEIWTIYEDRLEHSSGKTLLRIPTFNAFWFGWKASYPNTILIK
ncbi:DUF3179 domain-containing protein [Aquimarina rhabdastrellae]